MKFPGKLEAGRIDGVLTDAKYVKGAYLVVKSLAERDALSVGIKVVGVKCFVSDLHIEYQWSGTDWEEIGNVPQLPSDNNSIYALQNGKWVVINVGADIQEALAPINNHLRDIDDQIISIKDNINNIEDSITTLDEEVVKYTVLEYSNPVSLNEGKEYANSVDIDDPTTPSFYQYPESKAVPLRRTIQLKNYDSLSGFGTDYNGEDLSDEAFNLAMVSKWNVADFGSQGLHLNLNTKDNITINDNLTLLDSEDRQDLETLITDARQELEESINNTNTSIENINALIPTEATKDNQLVDNTTMEAFVSSSIENSAGNLVTYTNVVGGDTIFPTFDDLQRGPWYINGVEVIQTQLRKSDYATFLKVVDDVNEQWRASYSGTIWQEQYKIGSAFTPEEQAVLDSGITAAGVVQITTNRDNIATLTNDLNDKQDVIEDVSDTAVDGEYVSSVSQKDGQIVVTRGKLPEGTIKDITGEADNAVIVTNTNGVVEVAHKTEGFADGTQGDSSSTNIQVVTAINVDRGHITEVSLQNIDTMISALGEIILDGGAAEGSN